MNVGSESLTILDPYGDILKVPQLFQAPFKCLKYLEMALLYIYISSNSSVLHTPHYKAATWVRLISYSKLHN